MKIDLRSTNFILEYLYFSNALNSRDCVFTTSVTLLQELYKRGMTLDQRHCSIFFYLSALIHQVVISVRFLSVSSTQHTNQYMCGRRNASRRKLFIYCSLFYDAFKILSRNSLEGLRKTMKTSG
jgi:hypothetical protein